MGSENPYMSSAGDSARFDARRVAEVIVTCDGRSRRGSGYRITSDRVLTAAHVLADGTAVSVRFDADRAEEWNAPVTTLWSDTTADIAVLGFEPPASAPAAPTTRFGRLSEQRAVVKVYTAGFPRWKRRQDEVRVYRDMHDAEGRMSLVSNRRSRSIEISVYPPEQDPDPDVSPWQMMSGAAVWVGPRIVGVIAEHHRLEGLGRLTGIPVYRWLDQVDSSGRTLAEALGPASQGPLLDVSLPTHEVAHPRGRPRKTPSGVVKKIIFRSHKGVTCNLAANGRVVGVSQIDSASTVVLFSTESAMPIGVWTDTGDFRIKGMNYRPTQIDLVHRFNLDSSGEFVAHMISRALESEVVLTRHSIPFLGDNPPEPVTADYVRSLEIFRTTSPGRLLDVRPVDGGQFVLGRKPTSIVRWDASTGAETSLYQARSAHVPLTFSPDGSVVATTDGSSLGLRHLVDDEASVVLPWKGRIKNVRVDRAGSLALVLTEVRQAAGRWNVSLVTRERTVTPIWQGPTVPRIDISKDGSRAVVISKDGSRAVAAMQNIRVDVYDLRSPKAPYNAFSLHRYRFLGHAPDLLSEKGDRLAVLKNRFLESSIDIWST
ncbi:trypsin-like peptidase domain-containing protein [Streptomyces sp. NPDC060006]|uniref:trypsin-like peptidase domain-containing protein n=1 Tax=unclassified Streptomyces TaxID=2593676 RepID=UPI003699AAE6